MKDYMSLISEVSQNTFNISAIKPFQILVIHRVLEQDDYTDKALIRNQIIILPTGTGKSLCFLLPAVLCKGITIIVYPLLALMNDQISKLRRIHIKCCYLKGGQTKQQRNQVFQDLKTGVKILITNPETLCQNRVLRRLKDLDVSLFVCDEAHVISLWGKSFRPAYTKLKEAVKYLSPKQILSFTATASEETLKDIKACLYANMHPLIVKGDMDRENIFYISHPTINRSLGVLTLIKNCQKPALVFCRTRLSVMKLCILGLRNYPNIKQRFYHAGLKHSVREELENWFLASTDGILYATCAYGMGIDKKNIRTVIHYDLPPTVEEYLQESGRAGRDNKQAISYVIINEACNANGKNDVENIFSSNNCRRSELLKIMGQEKEECTGCDVCWGIRIKKSVELSLVEKMINKYPLRFSDSYISNILSGSVDKKIISGSEKSNPYYNSLNSYDPDLLQEGIKDLVTNKESSYKSITIKLGRSLLLNKNKHVLSIIYKILSFIKFKLRLE